jgi:hypothetical protein
MSTVAHRPRRGYRTLRLPINEADYERFMNEGEFAKAQFEELYARHPELFPAGFNQGYALYGFTEPSSKQQVRCQRIRLTADGGIHGGASVCEALHECDGGGGGKGAVLAAFSCTVLGDCIHVHTRSVHARVATIAYQAQVVLVTQMGGRHDFSKS